MSLPNDHDDAEAREMRMRALRIEALLRNCTRQYPRRGKPSAEEVLDNLKRMTEIVGIWLLDDAEHAEHLANVAAFGTRPA